MSLVVPLLNLNLPVQIQLTTKKNNLIGVKPMTLGKLAHILLDHHPGFLSQGKHPTQLEVLSGSRAPVTSSPTTPANLTNYLT